MSTPEVYRATGPMATRPPSRAPAPRTVTHPKHVNGRARQTTPLPNDALPYSVELYGRTRLYQNGHDALAFAHEHKGARVYFTAQRTEVIDVQLLPAPDKAKPPKGSCGAFCSGQTTKAVPLRATREYVTTRLY